MFKLAWRKIAMKFLNLPNLPILNENTPLYRNYKRSILRKHLRQHTTNSQKKYLKQPFTSQITIINGLSSPSASKWPHRYHKAMVQIFIPMAKNMLIYIDDLLVFSQDEVSYINHLRQFYDLLLQHEVMLSKRK